MTSARALAKPHAVVASSPAAAPVLLQRACACGISAGPSGSCSDCDSERRFGAPPLQEKASLLQRQPAGQKLPPPILDPKYPLKPLVEDNTAKTNDEEYEEGGGKVIEALLETETGKAVTDKVTSALFSTPLSSATTLGIVGGGIAGLALTHKELPFQLPAVPLGLFKPEWEGLSVGIIWNGPVDSPTEAALVFTFESPGPAKKKRNFAEDTARMAADQQRFRDSLQPRTGPAQPAGPVFQPPKPSPESTPETPGELKLTPSSLLEDGLPPGLVFNPLAPLLLGEGLKLELPQSLLPKAEEPPVQKKLSIGASNDPLELEADRVADQVLRQPVGSPRISPVNISATPLQRRAESTATPASEAVASRLGSSAGSPLPADTRGFFEPRFGRDLGHVRVHDGANAAAMAQAISARAFTHGSDIYFAHGEFNPDVRSGRHLLAHELTHVFQQGSGSTLRRTCTAAATCAAPIAGDPTGFGQSEEDKERPFRERRRRMAPVRARSTSHAGRARQLETILTGHDPALRAEVHGIFVDQDLSSGTEAMLAGCAAWRTLALPAADPDPDGFAAASKPCIFIHGILNQQGLKFNNGDATVGGRPREVWRDDTVVTMTHEVQHAVFDNTIAPALARPGAVTSATCTGAATQGKLSEIVAQVSEFPTRFTTAAAEADPTGPAHQRLDAYFVQVMSGGESLPGALTALGCACDCPEIDALVVQAVNASTTAFTAAQKTELRTRLRGLMPGPARPIWPSTPV